MNQICSALKPSELFLPGQTVSEGIIIGVFGYDTYAVCCVQAREFRGAVAIVMYHTILVKLQHKQNTWDINERIFKMRVSRNTSSTPHWFVYCLSQFFLPEIEMFFYSKVRSLTWTGLQYWATTPWVWFPNTSVNTRKWYESSLLSLVILKPSGQWQSTRLLSWPLDAEVSVIVLHTAVTWETELLQGYEVDVLRYAEVLWGGDCWVDVGGDGSLSLLLERASPLGSAEGQSVRTLHTVTWALSLNKRRSVNL